MTQPLGGCPGCGGDEPFEQVHGGQRAGDPCPDADECPEWACLGCGAALYLGTIVSAGVLTGTSQPAPVRARQSARAA